MVNNLIVPEAFAGGGIQSHQRIGKEILTVTLGAIEIGLGGLGSDIHDPAFLVQGLSGPWHEPGGCFVSLGRPRVVTEFPRARNEMENPAASARAHVEASYGSRASEAAGYQDVLVDDAWSIQTNIGRYLGV